jgi:hypothetical protein
MWPWLLIIPPAAAVIGGGLTLYLAITRPDSLVREDCVRDGVTMRCGDDEAAPGDDRDAKPPAP